MRKTFILFCGSILLSVSAAHAQPKFQYPAEKGTFGPRFYAQTWRLNSSAGNATIRAVYTPLVVAIPLSPKCDLNFSGAAAVSNLNNGTSQTLQGLTDTKIRGVMKFNDYHWLLHAGLNLPTGKNALKTQEVKVNNVLAEAVLGFPVKRYGRGLEVDAGVAYAFGVSENLKTGLGAGILLKGEHAFLQNSPLRFDPGDEISVTGGFNFKKNNLAMRLSLLTKIYQKDRLNRQAAFKEGTQVETEGMIAFSPQKIAVVLAVKNVMKADNVTYASSGEILGAARDNFSGNIFWSTGQVTYNVSESLALTSSLGLSVFGKSEVQLGEAQLFNLGGGLQFKSSEHLMFNTALAFSTGNAKDAQSQTWNLQGFLLTGGLLLRY